MRREQRERADLLRDVARGLARLAQPLAQLGRQDVDLRLELRRRGTTIVFSTHDMAAAERLCDQLHAQGVDVLYDDREESPGVTMYAHIGTGNYNPKTARLYTDVGLFTTDPDIGADVANKLFPAGNALGSEITVRGLPYRVIGVEVAKGTVFGIPQDTFIILPLKTYAVNYGGLIRQRSLYFVATSKTDELFNDAVEESRFLMRVRRKLGPNEKDNFGIVTPDEAQIKAHNKCHFTVVLDIKRALKQLPQGASDEEATRVLSPLVPQMLQFSKCPDLIVNRGHYFGTDKFQEEPALSDEDKRALIEFLKTF